MLSSDIAPKGLRPASPGATKTYRSVSQEVMSAAIRAGVSYPKPPNLSRNVTSRYEFPGDRGYQLFLKRGTT